VEVNHGGKVRTAYTLLYVSEKLLTYQWCQSHRLCLTIQLVEALHLMKEILWIKWHCDRSFSEYFGFPFVSVFPPLLLIHISSWSADAL